MASVTLAESAKLCQNELIAGVIENVITVNKIFEILPFDGIEGNALGFNRENALGDVQLGTVDTAITAKAAATFTAVTASLTSIIGDAEVNGLIRATRSVAGTDQVAVQVSSKAKSCGRKYQDMFINGTGSSNEFVGLLALTAAGQTIAGATNGEALGFAALDELFDSIVDKDGEVDWCMMHQRTLRSYFALVRSLGGTTPMDVYELPSGKTVPAYRQTGLFRNDWIPVTQTQGTSSTCTSILAGNFDDGSQSMGISGLTTNQDAGIHVEDVGVAEAADNHIWRIKFYCGLANYCQKGLAMKVGINN